MSLISTETSNASCTSKLFTSCYMSQTLLFFDGKGGQSSSRNVEEDKEICKRGTTLDMRVSYSNEEDHPMNSEESLGKRTLNSITSLDTRESSFSSENKDLPINTTGVLISIYLNTCFYYCFAVQETITTPMVMKLYDWSATKINLLFAAAGVTALITSLSVQYITRFV